MTHLIITTANIPQAYLFRKKQYIHSILTCLKFTHLFDSYCILECYSKNEEYLNEYKTHYSNDANIYSNKGLNEMMHLKSYLNQSNISDNDTLIKLSGRYILEDESFLKIVSEKSNEYDSFFKDDSDIYVGKGYHTFLFAIKKSMLLETINTLNFSQHNEVPIEWDFKNYLHKKEKNLIVNRLNVIAYQGTYSEKIFRC